LKPETRIIAVDDAEIPTIVDHADITGQEKPIASHRARGVVRALPVAGHDLWPAQCDLAGHADLDLVPGVIHQAYFHVRQRHADGAGEGVAVGRVAGDAGAALRQAIAFNHRTTGHLQPLLCRCLDHGGAAAICDHQLRPVDVRSGGVVGDRIEECVDCRENIDPVRLQRFEHALDVTRVRDQDVQRTGPQRE
jgi:hypothetical protein